MANVPGFIHVCSFLTCKCICRYFTGTDAYKQHMYNFWHGVLAGYFEGVDDMDRKAEVTEISYAVYSFIQYIK